MNHAMSPPLPPPAADGADYAKELSSGPATRPDATESREEAIFSEALELPPAERAAFVAQACADDPALERRVRRLLDGHDAAGEVFETGVDAAMEVEMARLKPEEAGDQIGPYRLIEQIGEGSFGVVWKAEQERPVKRVVALKIIKLGMDTKEVIARFEQERQALALMDHPNIAKVFDAGATQFGRPFFAMELVKGSRITSFCDAHSMEVKDRLKLFVAICRAVQHAHQKGIIHRDLKPSNILVTQQDGKAVPKVIDFGVAKATERRLTELTICTEFEQLIGTPLYMSPEQADMSGQNVDTRTDIYSLGVILYELLTGRTPFDRVTLMATGYAEMRRIIREEEPPKPSTVLRAMASEGAVDAAFYRHSERTRLIQTLSGDLDWIVMKSLEKDRVRRYDTANDFAADILRYLRHEPIVARPPSQMYRLHRFVWRHRTGVISAASIAAALVIGFTVAVWHAARANTEADRANREAARANRALLDLRGMASALAAEAREFVIQGNFDAAIAKLGLAIQLRPEAAEHLRERAALLRSQLKLAAAAEDYRSILDLHPEDAQAHTNLAMCERLAAAPLGPDGKIARSALAELHAAMTAEARPAAELMPFAKALGLETEVLRSFWLERLRALPNATNKPLEERLKMRPDGLLDLDLSGTSTADLSLLKDMPLSTLNLAGCPVRSIAPLGGMPLRKLDLSGTQVESLAAVAQMPSLQELSLTGVPVTDLAPLEGMSLRVLRLARTEVSDLSPLEGMPLTHLELGQTRVSDLGPIAQPGLKILECSYTPVADYRPLVRTQLDHLALEGARVGDLSFLRRLPLKSLVLTGARNVSNLRVLAEIKTLEFLLLPGNPLQWGTAELDAIGSLKAHPALKQISCGSPAGSSPTNAEPAATFWQTWDGMMKWGRPLLEAGIKPVTKPLPDGSWQVVVQDPRLDNLAMFAGANISAMDLTNCQKIRDLSPLRGLPLKTLGIAHTAVSDLSPLAGMPLQSLWMAQTPVSNLEPLRGLPLKTLYMDKCALLSDVAPLADLPQLQEVLLPESATKLDGLRKLKLQRISYTYDAKRGRPACAAEHFWKHHREVNWLGALRAKRIPLACAQLTDGTWQLVVNDASFDDLEVLKGAPISELYLHGTGVENLQPLTGMPLRALRLDGTPCTDVSPLAGIATLEALVLPERVKDFTPLRGSRSLKRVAFDADAAGRPALEVSEFWRSLAQRPGR